MKKIPTLFVRDFERKPALVTPAISPGCEWVAAGEGTATRKYDGACCAVINGTFYKRLETTAEKQIDFPTPGFVEVDRDPLTNKIVGWVPVGEGPEDKWFREALPPAVGAVPEDGTYELVGPKVQKNPENYGNHALLKHSDAEVLDAPRDYDGLRAWLDGRDIEGIVWHHPDGRMAKIKARDFGYRRDKTVARSR